MINLHWFRERVLFLSIRRGGGNGRYVYKQEACALGVIDFSEWGCGSALFPDGKSENHGSAGVDDRLSKSWLCHSYKLGY